MLLVIFCLDPKGYASFDYSDCWCFPIGTESKALGVHVQLGPVGGPLGKIPVVRLKPSGLYNEMLNYFRQEEIGRDFQMIPTYQELEWQMYGGLHSPLASS
jgi:hypothetical protein